jgi:non-specific serine/threonine protein kinase/serine/threonine-protein kinase
VDHSKSCDEELLRRLPLPLARLYRRAHNAKSPFDRHQAAYFFWEASLRLLASTAVIAFAERPAPEPDLVEALRKLARPSLGDWWAIVRRLVPLLADAGDSGFAGVRALVLDRARDDMPRSAELDQALCDSLGIAPGPQRRVRVSELFERLVRYRNREIGHGAAGLKPETFYDHIGRVLLPGVAELLGRFDVLAGRRLIYVEEVAFLKSGAHLVKRLDLTGESARRIESLEWPAAESARLPRPEHVYLDSPSLISMRPLVVYDPRLDDVLFLSAQRSRLRCEYLCFATGEQQERDELEGEQRDLLARILGGPIDPAAFARWAEASQAGEPAPAGPAPARPPRRMDEFELLSELGRGNMGTVYRAWQPSLGRQVALKVVARSDERAIARFRREVRALGKVDHPHLVKIFTSQFDSEPCYFTMELVEGASLAAVADTLQGRGTAASALTLDTWREAVEGACAQARKAEKPLSEPGVESEPGVPLSGVRQSASPAMGRDYVRQVVELVRQVAVAAQALHASGVVHRDIKPGNILLTADGAQAVLMDLGLAQLADDVEGRLTRTRQFVGTLRYASPEQVLSAGAVDHRSDIYSLGATLWELLALRPIYDASDQTPDPELMRRITLDDPDRLRKHHPGLPRDLEAIVQKCLEKNPAQRYATAAELADDLDRWLRGDLVTAQPLTFRYWAGKLARRYRWQMTGAAAVILLVASGMVAEIYRSKRANERLQRVNDRLGRANADLKRALAEVDAQKIRAETANAKIRTALAEVDAQKKKAEAALVRAEASSAAAKKSAKKAEAINNFLVNDMLGQAAPEQNARARKITVEELLDRAAEKIDSAFVDQPDVQADIRMTVAETYSKLGEDSRAESQFRRAWEIRNKTLGPAHPSTLITMDELANVLHAQGKLAEAETLLRRVLEARRRVLGPDDPDTLTSMNDLGTAVRSRGKLGEAETLLRQVIDAQRRVLGRENPHTLMSMNNLATLLWSQGKAAEAEKIERDALEVRRRVAGPDHPDVLRWTLNLGAQLTDQGKLPEAEALGRRLVEDCRRVLGQEHPVTLMSTSNLASVLWKRGKLPEAETLNRQVLEARRRVLGAEHPDTLTSMGNLATVLLAQRKRPETETLLRQVLEAQRRVLGPEHPNTLLSMSNLAAVSGPSEAETLRRQVLEARRRVLGPEHPDTLTSMSLLAQVLQAQGKRRETEMLFRQVVDARHRVLGSEHPDTLNSMYNLATFLRNEGNFDEAERLYRQELETCRRVKGPEDPDTLASLDNLALFLLDKGNPDGAEPFLRELLRIRRKAVAVNELALANTLSPLGWALTDTGRADEAEPLLREALGIRRNRMPRHWASASTESILGACLSRQGRYGEAEPMLKESLGVLLEVPGVPPLRVAQALGRIIALYDAWDKPDEAKAWRLKRLDFEFPADPFVH